MNSWSLFRAVCVCSWTVFFILSQSVQFHCSRKRYFFFPPDATLMVSEALFFPSFESAVAEPTVAVLLMVVLPRAITVTWICAAS